MFDDDFTPHWNEDPSRREYGEPGDSVQVEPFPEPPVIRPGLFRAALLELFSVENSRNSGVDARDVRFYQDLVIRAVAHDLRTLSEHLHESHTEQVNVLIDYFDKVLLEHHCTYPDRKRAHLNDLDRTLAYLQELYRKSSEGTV